MDIRQRINRDWRLTRNASLGMRSRSFSDFLTLGMLLLALLIVIGYVAAQVDYLDQGILEVSSAISVAAVAPLAWLAKCLMQRDKRFLRRLASQRLDYFLVANPLAMIAMQCRVVLLIARSVAMVLPLPGITNVNLSPRLLPVPRARLGAA